jgi:hypothetical protein
MAMSLVRGLGVSVFLTAVNRMEPAVRDRGMSGVLFAAKSL